MLQSSWSIEKTVYEVYLTTSLLAIKTWLFHETYINLSKGTEGVVVLLCVLNRVAHLYFKMSYKDILN